ncbi:lipopolysaccharide biosynthesis protein, partial [Paenibacillus sp. NPDC056579]|uniref:lipopolysaccharide biosynthesis protein n=1 Tax=Paenibacillus sp. NPDC056579 TaxID=3345871 RepID=UPI0036A4259F
MNKIIANYLFNTLNQILAIFLPFITIPYTARVLGAEKIGLNAYTFSIVQILMVIGTVGIPLYANRQIAIQSIKGKNELTKEFWSIYTIQVVGLMICTGSYLYYSLCFSEYRILSLLQGLHLLSCMLDITWLLTGLQKFKETITRSIIVKCLSVILIFIFVKEE